MPVRETSKCLLESDLWQKSGEHSAESPSDVLSDISDRQIFKLNDFLVIIHHVLSYYYIRTPLKLLTL